MPSGGAVLAGKADEFILAAARGWKLFKEVKEKAEPFSKLNDSLEMATRDMSGELSAYDSNIEKVRAYVANQKDKLAELARQDENYWMDRSGANVFDKMAMFKAKNNIDQWITNFSTLKTLIQQFLPAVRNAQLVLSNNAVVATRSAIEESSLPALDGIALSQVVGDLNNSVRSLDLIVQRLRTCRVHPAMR
jgi:hypothetical protein